LANAHLSVVTTLWAIRVVLTGQSGPSLKNGHRQIARHLVFAVTESGLHRGRGFQAVFAAFNPSRASTASRITNF
jgi:hypothetical protein